MSANEDPMGDDPMSRVPPLTDPGVQTKGQSGLPKTGLQQQMESLNEQYENFKNVEFAGYDPRRYMFEQQQAAGGNDLEGNSQTMAAGSSLDSMARNLAERYGLPIGRGRLVDESGNFLYTPEQLANASGGSMTMGEAAAKMMYISQALTRKQNEQQQAKGVASLEVGLGQIQSRGRGSLASMQSGYYQDLADMYANQQYGSTDFSYFIQREQQLLAVHLMERAEAIATAQARSNFIIGVAIAVGSAITGNYAGAAYGTVQAGASAEQTGWF